jgi:hypothetical protein
MPVRSSVTIVASPRSRAGKTLIARLLTDFHTREGRPVAAFDLNSGGGTLAQFLPGQTTVSAIGDVKGQMALFDRLIADDGTAKVVDLGHESFDMFFTIAQQIGFAEEALRRTVPPAVLFVVTPDRAAVEAFRRLRAALPQAMLGLVRNEIFGAAHQRDAFELMGSGAVMVRLPMLAPGVRKYVETPPFSFADEQLAAAVDMPLEVHLELQRWLRRVHREFREIELRTLLADLQSSMRLDS